MAQDHGATGDRPMHRRLFVEMSYDEQIAWLEGVRARRNRAAEQHAQLMLMKAAARDERLQAKIIKKRDQLQKLITRLDALLEKTDLLVNELHVLRLEASIE